jgi:UDP-N-acetylglucosamine--N-acetylmuramyl-(pentapeptide) pyrophosphoryl-undecaprenol N-acetylglucosamine transferase
VKVIAVAGSSGGHIFPAIAFLEALKEQSKEIESLLVVPKRSPCLGFIPDKVKVKTISTTSLSKRLGLLNVSALFHFMKGSIESLFIFIAFRPDAVVGFGGLDSLPLVLLGWLGRGRTVIHEQNCLPGRANRLLARFCDKIAVSFPETQKYLGLREERIVFTGNPLRQELRITNRQEALDYFGFKDKMFTVLVMGGSSGSHKINTCFLDAVAGLTEGSTLQIIHISGSADYELMERGYRNLGSKVKLFSFLKEMPYAYTVADLAVCRAGATTVAELMRFKLPALLIPYPYAHNHQEKNAQILSSKGCALILREEECGTGALKKNLFELIMTPERVKRMRESYNGFEETRAGERLAQLLLS